MRIKEEFDADDPALAREVVRAHPFATMVTAGLQATHMPCLVDEAADGLTILGHLACADPAVDGLGGPLLRRTVDHFEAAVERPWSLDRMGETADEMAGEVRGFRLRASCWHLEAKLSQDKPGDERARILAGLERPGPYENRALAAAMRDERLRRRSAR